MRTREQLEAATAPRVNERAGDTALLIAAQNGDSAAFGELVRIYQRRVYAVARTMLRSHHDAEDAAQDTFLAAYQALGKFKATEAFGPWIYRIATNTALSLYRRRKVRTTEELIPSDLRLPEYDPAESSELSTRLASALATLSARARAVVILHDVHGFTHGEIGAMYGLADGSIRAELHHARRSLRKSLADLYERD